MSRCGHLPLEPQLVISDCFLHLSQSKGYEEGCWPSGRVDNQVYPSSKSYCYPIMLIHALHRHSGSQGKHMLPCRDPSPPPRKPCGGTEAPRALVGEPTHSSLSAHTLHTHASMCTHGL